MPKGKKADGGTRVSALKLLEYYDTLKGGSEESKIEQTSTRFSVPPKTVISAIMMREAKDRFPTLMKRKTRAGAGPSKSEKEVLVALNKWQTISAAAEKLEVTPLTLTKWKEHYKITKSERYAEDGKKMFVWAKQD